MVTCHKRSKIICAFIFCPVCSWTIKLLSHVISKQNLTGKTDLGWKIKLLPQSKLSCRLYQATCLDVKQGFTSLFFMNETLILHLYKLGSKINLLAKALAKACEINVTLNHTSHKTESDTISLWTKSSKKSHSCCSCPSATFNFYWLTQHLRITSSTRGIRSVSGKANYWLLSTAGRSHQELLLHSFVFLKHL